ncbi:substrate-binding domain-containing protein [Roseococcus sp. SDR]|uniref:substrate-binding domain-containing protein n=1 Tax=Roseococcus sp. SDR TaxID=2835532 RepID=UPI001BD05D3D|nr:substrate-binding domain-containing protein [Roseococcus sp. SDR]MBS7789152.1 substrate-binding domain-containing protein [Roseococcus sp. SDR]MBV1844466.1 substrate-binding domain-containing protein [Roseococcus sp. SDR]
MQRRSLPLALGAGLGLLAARPARAAEITLLCSNGLRSVAEVALPEFERATGHRVVASYGASSILAGRIMTGLDFEVTVLTPSLISELAAAGRVAPDSAVTLARAGLGLAVREGAPRPDISTPEGLRGALLGASSIVVSSAGQSGMGFRRVIETLGISGELTPRLRPNAAGMNAALVARGEAEMAVQLVPELMGVPGAVVVGPFPPALQSFVVLTAGLRAGAREPAQALLRFLADPARHALIREKGLQPG